MPPQIDVLIVGLGPTGAVLAGLLAKAGVSVLAIDRETEPYPLPRAAHFDAETMQTFARLGIAEAVGRQARPISDYVFRNAAGETLMHIANRPAPGSRWQASYMFHQPALEEALRGALAGLPGLEIALGARLVDIARNDPDGVTAELEAPDGPRTVHARFIVGCDGGASPTRGLIGGKLFDYGFDEPWLVVDCLATDEEGLPQHGLQVCDPARPTTVMPMSPLRRRWEFMLLPGETAEAMLAEGVAERLLEPWGRPGQLSVVRKAVYRFHGLVAERWREGCVLLAGDAAHQMPPFMGQGMCSGIRDAANLAWKLEWVLKGRAAPALLDTYQTEREPHVRAIVEAAIGMGRVVCTLDPQMAAMRDQAMKSGQAPRPSPPTAGPGLWADAPGAYFPALAESAAAGAFALVTTDNGPALPAGFIRHHRGPTGLLRPDGYLFGAGEGAALIQAALAGLAAPGCP